MKTLQESYTTWAKAIERVTLLRLAGYRAYAVGMGDHVRVTVEPGKHPDLSRVPSSQGAQA
jgi:hypothetical protein